MMKAPALALALGLLVLSLAGCDDAPQPNYAALGLVPVTGTVTLDGQPLPSAVVTFTAADGQFAYGMTDTSGRYSLQIDSVMKGCPRGSRKVQVSTARKITGLNSDEEGGDGGEGPPKPKGKEAVPAKFNKETELTVDVTPDKTRYDFDLKS